MSIKKIFQGGFDMTKNTQMEEDMELITVPKGKSSHKNRPRVQKRKNDFQKAIRKRKLDRSIHPEKGFEYTYNNLHQYSHNKITCPCPLCKPKNFGIDTKDKFSVRKKKKAGEDALREYQTGEISYNYETEEEVVL